MDLKVAGVPHATNDLMLVASPVTNDPLSVGNASVN